MTCNAGFIPLTKCCYHPVPCDQSWPIPTAHDYSVIPGLQRALSSITAHTWWSLYLHHHGNNLRALVSVSPDRLMVAPSVSPVRTTDSMPEKAWLKYRESGEGGWGRRGWEGTERVGPGRGWRGWEGRRGCGRGGRGGSGVGDMLRPVGSCQHKHVSWPVRRAYLCGWCFHRQHFNLLDLLTIF